MSFWSEGGEVRAVWKRSIDESARVEFLCDDGDCVLPRAHAECELAGFVGKVVYRLESNGITATPLQNEWNAILAMEPGERRFCCAAASIGLDPFDLPDGAEGQILAAADLLPSSVLDDFFPCADADKLLDDARVVAEVICELEAKKDESPRINEIRDKVKRAGAEGTGWEYGYRLAHQARKLLSLSSGRVEIGFMEELTLPREIVALADVSRIEGIVSRNGSAGASGVAPGFDARREDSRKFALARSLCEVLDLLPSKVSLLTRERTTRQKTNRAFAAEFLVPADELRQRIISGIVTSEEVLDLAEEYGVSSYVVENQIRNHGLGSITI